MKEEIDLRMIDFTLTHHGTIVKKGQPAAEMYCLATKDGTCAISLSVPPGRGDIASFIFASCRAGQQTLRDNPGITVTAPSEGTPAEPKTKKGMN